MSRITITVENECGSFIAMREQTVTAAQARALRDMWLTGAFGDSPGYPPLARRDVIDRLVDRGLVELCGFDLWRLTLIGRSFAMALCGQPARIDDTIISRRTRGQRLGPLARAALKQCAEQREETQ